MAYGSQVHLLVTTSDPITGMNSNAVSIHFGKCRKV